LPIILQKFDAQSFEKFSLSYSYFFPSQKLSHLLPSSYPTKPPKTHKNKNIIDFILFSLFNVVEAHYCHTTSHNLSGFHPKTVDIIFWLHLIKLELILLNFESFFFLICHSKNKKK
jgi:hypothetical protein